MSKEERAILLLEVYNQEKERLVKESISKKAEIVRQQADREISPAEADLKVMELKAYVEIERGRIERRFLRAICALER